MEICGPKTRMHLGKTDVWYGRLRKYKCLSDRPPISYHLMQSSTSPPLLNYNIHKQYTSKQKHFMHEQLLNTTSHGLTC